VILRIDAMAAGPARNPSIRKPLRERDIYLEARRGALRPTGGRPKTRRHDHRYGADPYSDDAAHFHKSALAFQFVYAAIVPRCSSPPRQSQSTGVHTGPNARGRPYYRRGRIALGDGETRAGSTIRRNGCARSSSWSALSGAFSRPARGRFFCAHLARPKRRSW
jgi:hypothetical protein